MNITWSSACRSSPRSITKINFRRRWTNGIARWTACTTRQISSSPSSATARPARFSCSSRPSSPDSPISTACIPVMSTADRAGAVLEVDLAAIVANWRLLCTMHPSGPVAGVVKADGYGLGARPIAQALYQAGCRHFFVALLDEALAIRELVPDAMLAVLCGLVPGNEPDHPEHDIVPVLGSLGEIDAWAAISRSTGHALPAILHIDTGMSRLGLDADELAALRQDHARLAGIQLRYVMTHLVASEVAGDPLNQRQRERFAAACAGLPPAPRSFANSSGIFLGTGWHSDLARPGAALYGINPTPASANLMRPVVRLSARVLAVREVPVGVSVGYNGTWRAARPSRIATAGIG